MASVCKYQRVEEVRKPLGGSRRGEMWGCMLSDLKGSTAQGRVGVPNQ